MSAPTISPGAASPLPTSPSAPPPGDAGAGFDAHMANANTSSRAAGSPTPSAAGTPSELPGDGGEMDEAAFQKQMFSSFAEGLDPEVQERLSKWLPDVLNGGKKKLKTAAKDLSKQEAKDLDALSEALDLKHDFGKVKDRDGLIGNLIEKVEHKSNKKGLEQLKRDYGEFALKASTPGLAPAVSYDTPGTLDATREAVYEQFVSGLSDADQKQLDDFLPDVLFGDKSAKKATKKLSDKEEDALKALAKEHDIDLPSILGGKPKGDLRDRLYLEGLETAFKRDLALETTGELPSVVDMLLVEKFGRENGDTAVHIDLKDDKILKEAKAFKKDFGELDAWLPDVLAGRGEMPEGDKAAKKLLVEFAEEFGFDPKKGDDLGERADKALASIEKQGVFEKTLHPGKDGKDTAFLLFTDRFMESTLAYGAKNGALDQSQLLDAANVAEMLLGPDDGTDAPREVDTAGLQAAILHRTDKQLARPQEVMAASGYINAAETLAEQKTRLTEVVLAFHVREEIGTAPMTPLQWAKNYADLHPEMLDDLGNRAFNAPTGEKLQIVTQHLGVPGEHEFMVDKKREIKMEVDQVGNLDHFDVDKKKTKWYKKVLDVAVPVIGTVLTFVPGAQAIGMGINMAYGAYKGAESIRNGDILGGIAGIATAFVPGSKVVQVASGALKTVRVIESKDWMGALAGGLGTMASGGAGQRFQTAANGISTAQSLKEGDFLQAGAGIAGMAGDATAGSSSQYAFDGLEQGLNLADGIQEKNYAGIGNAAAGLISTRHAYDEYREEQAKLPPMTGVSIRPDAHGGPGAPALDADGKPIILQAGYTNPDGTQPTHAIEVAGGDTLSQIAARHGTTVDDLMAANPGIDDPNRIYAGQALALPEGVQPVGLSHQDRLREMELVGGGRPIFPSPSRPDLGYSTLQPGATHPNADPHTPIHAQPGATHPNAGGQPGEARDEGQADPTSRPSTQDKLDELDRRLLDQAIDGERPLPSSPLFDSNATPYVNTPGNPTGMRPNTPVHSDTVVYSADGVELHEAPYIAGPEQTQSYGLNFDLPFIGDGTLGVTFEYGEEYDFGPFLELGPIWSPYAINDGTGWSIPTDWSVGINGYGNTGFVPFETGAVHTMEHMAQYVAGGGFNVDENGSITSINAYLGFGAGGSRTYDTTINFSVRDSVRAVGNLFKDADERAPD